MLHDHLSVVVAILVFQDSGVLAGLLGCKFEASQPGVVGVWLSSTVVVAGVSLRHLIADVQLLADSINVLLLETEDWLEVGFKHSAVEFSRV
jgi:hypothetical protein